MTTALRSIRALQHAARSISQSRYIYTRLSSTSTSSKATGHLPGYPSSPFLSSFQDAVFNAVNANASQSSTSIQKGIPTYRLMDGAGNLLPGVNEEELKLDKEEAIKIIRHMLLLPALDVILYNAQRQGRISFMMTSHGEEAAVIGSASALDTKDEVFAQYREMGVLLYRGFTLDQIMNQVSTASMSHNTYLMSLCSGLWDGR
jgi:2-oxoisovalerate dehydrogenase E1 component alpha subunit